MGKSRDIFLDLYTGCGEKSRYLCGRVNRVWGKLESFMCVVCAQGVGKIRYIYVGCTQGDGKGRDIYVVFVYRLWVKVEFFMWTCTQGVWKGRDIYVVCAQGVGKSKDIYLGVYTGCGER